MAHCKTNSRILNLCDSCLNCISHCNGQILEFGEAPGDDNVIECMGYEPNDEIPEGIEIVNE